MLASFGLDQLVAARKAHDDRGRLAAFMGVAVGLAALGVLLGFELVDHDVGRAGAIATDAARHEVAWISGTSALGVAAIVGVRRLSSRSLRRVAATMLPLVVFAQGGMHLRDFNSTIDERYFYPRTEALQRLTATTRGQIVLGADASAIPPEANTWYGIAVPAQYDAVGVRGYERLARRLLRYPRYVIAGEEIGGLVGAPYPVSAAALRTLGIRFVTSNSDYPWATPISSTITSGAAPTWRRLPSGGSAEWQMKGPSRSSQAITVRTRGASGTCTLSMRPAGDVTKAFAAHAPCGDGITSFAAPVPGSTGAPWTLAIDGPPGIEIGVDRAGTPQATLYATSVVGLQALWRQQGVRLFAVPGAPPRYYTPPRVEVTSHSVAAKRIASPSFDARDTVIITGNERDVAPSHSSGGTVRVLHRSSEAVRLRVVRADAGILVALQSKFPGWVARVNGKQVPILEANSAFQGIPVPAGSSIVELVYKPESVRIGKYLSVGALTIALVCAAAATGVLLRRRRR